MTQKITRKPSWQYDDLAQKIQVAPRREAAKLVLLHLAKKANDAGQSHHGYDSIAAHCSIARSVVAPALKYLRDTLKLVTWTAGKGGSQRGTNRYTLDITAMRKLIVTQDVFDPTTWKLIRSESVEQTGNESAERSGLKIKARPLNGPDKSKLGRPPAPSESAERSVTPIEPPIKNNPQPVSGDGLVFSEKGPDGKSLPNQANLPTPVLSAIERAQAMIRRRNAEAAEKLRQRGGVQ